MSELAKINEIINLKNQVTELQTNNTKLMLQLQALKAYGGRERRQKLFLDLVKRMFGEPAANLKERALRLVEESIEAAQSVGISANQLYHLIDFVYEKRPGNLRSELGGVATTLIAFCEAAGFRCEDVERDELERTLSLDDELVKAKHAAKVSAGVAI